MSLRTEPTSVVAALGCAGAIALLLVDPEAPLREPLSAATFHGPLGVPLLTLRLALLMAALGGPPAGVAMTAALFLASLALQGTLPLFAIAAALTGLRRAQPRPYAALSALLLALTAAAFAASHAGPAPAPTPGADLAADVRHFAEVGNRYRARDAAARWCRREPAPGPGCLVLAQAQLELGAREAALGLARRVRDGSPDAPTRARAAEWLARQGGAP